jgi:tRNA threonylcarbamoyladenosine biosynthesis protein TsaB
VKAEQRKDVLDESGCRNSGRERGGLLVLDTSTDWAAVGLLTPEGRVHELGDLPIWRHGRDLLPSIRDLLREAEWSLGQLDAVAVGLGPGSFTGLRIGVTTAKLLAYLTGAELIGLDSLEGIAQNAPAHILRIHVVADAQRKAVYAAEFARSAAGSNLLCVHESRVESLEVWSSRLAQGGGAMVLGPGLESEAIRACIPSGLEFGPRELNRPDAARLIQMARRYQEEGNRADLWSLAPRYLLRSAAEEQWHARAGPQSS